jgi:lipopolysaccharide export system permease protein
MKGWDFNGLAFKDRSRQWWLRVPLLDRYLLRELIKPFLFGVGAVSSVGVAAGSLFSLLQDVTATRIPLDIALQVLVLQIPRFISLSLPIALLMASLLTISRLLSERELTAMQACGVSFGRLVRPILLFGLCITLAMFGLNEAIVPFTQYQSKLALRKPLQEGQITARDKNIFYPEYGPDKEVRRFFYAQSFDGKSMQGLTILDFTRSEANQIIAAESATWDSQGSRWQFRDGRLYIVTSDGSEQSVSSFSDQDLYVPRDATALAAPTQSLEDMSIADAQVYLATVQQQGNQLQTRKAQIRIQQQLSLPLVSVIFAFIGTALGSTLQGLSSSTGFGMSALIVLGYYILMFLTNNLGNLGWISPVLAAWLPNACMVGISVWLFKRINR